MPREPDPTFGDVDDAGLPLAVLVHGFPDTPHTWRHLGPMLADAGYRAVATWLPGYREAATGPISVGTYVRHVLDVAKSHGGDERSVLIGHDWGAISGYGAVATDPAAFRAYVALAVPPTPAIGAGLFRYQQLRRSFYIWFIQQVGLAEMALLEPGFWESLWSDWSPGYDAGEDLEALRRHVTAETIAGVVAHTGRPSTRTSPTRTRSPRRRRRSVRHRFPRCTCTEPMTGRWVQSFSTTSRPMSRPTCPRRDRRSN